MGVAVGAEEAVGAPAIGDVAASLQGDEVPVAQLAEQEKEPLELSMMMSGTLVPGSCGVSP